MAAPMGPTELGGPAEEPPQGEAPAAALRAVLKRSAPLPSPTLPVRGYDFADGPDPGAVLRSFLTTGFQATSFARAVAEIRRMVRGAVLTGRGVTGARGGPGPTAPHPPYRVRPRRSRPKWSR